jgi:hypothetical protein
MTSRMGTMAKRIITRITIAPLRRRFASYVNHRLIIGVAVSCKLTAGRLCFKQRVDAGTA